jgi:hypothetical protein
MQVQRLLSLFLVTPQSSEGGMLSILLDRKVNEGPQEINTYLHTQKCFFCRNGTLFLWNFDVLSLGDHSDRTQLSAQSSHPAKTSVIL